MCEASSCAQVAVKAAQRMQLSPADARVHVNAAALMAAGDTSNTSDTETSSTAEENDIEADDMPRLVESCDDSDLGTTIVTVPANGKASWTKEVTANFAKLTRRRVMLADDLKILVGRCDTTTH